MSSVAHVALVPRGGRVDMSEVANVAAALSIQIVRDFGPIWGVHATVSAFPKASDVPVGFWPIFVEDAGRLPEGAKGVHLDERNQPYALIEAGPMWSLDASHECLEMLVDNGGNRLLSGPLLEGAVDLGLPQHQVQYIVEVCDPVQDAQYGYHINGILMSDFFTPCFYDPICCTGARYDFNGALNGPREVVINGYISWLDPVTNDAMQLQNFLGPDFRLHPQVVNLSQSVLFQEVLMREAYRSAIARVTVLPDLRMGLSREQQLAFETKHRAARHAAQIQARRMEQELQRVFAEPAELLGL